MSGHNHVTVIDSNAPHFRERELTVTRPPCADVPTRPEVKVKAFDFTPIPYDPDEAAKLPPAVFDTVEVYAGWSNDSIMLKLDSLDVLIDTLIDLRDRLKARP